ncbi:MAG: phosphocholine cytidylyltransferase family protein [archaeon]|nr:phosphocholine cytidylyltransferase family protein [archaeon]
MKAIILSAGRGTRMMPLTKNTPKCLLQLENGSSVLETQLDAIEKSGKVDEVILVLGYLAEQVEAKIAHYKNRLKIKVVYNPFYDSANNLMSLWCAHFEMDSDFVIINGDDIFHESVLNGLLTNKGEGIFVTIDKLPSYTEDDMKVKMEGKKIVFINKKIPQKEANGESVGMILVRGKKNIDGCAWAILRLVRQPESKGIFWLEAFNEMARNNFALTPFEISQDDWCEIDFHADLKILKKKVLKFGWDGFGESQ